MWSLCPSLPGAVLIYSCHLGFILKKVVILCYWIKEGSTVCHHHKANSRARGWWGRKEGFLFRFCMVWKNCELLSQILSPLKDPEETQLSSARPEQKTVSRFLIPIKGSFGTLMQLLSSHAGSLAYSLLLFSFGLPRVPGCGAGTISHVLLGLQVPMNALASAFSRWARKYFFVSLHLYHLECGMD